MTASLKVFWNDEPAPLKVPDGMLVLPPPPAVVVLDELDLLLLPHAASSVANPTTTTSARERLRVAFKGDLLRSEGQVVRSLLERADRTNGR